MYTIGIVHETPIPTWSSRQLLLAIENKNCKGLYLRPSKISIRFSTKNMRVYYGQKEISVPDALIIRNLGFTSTYEQLVKRASTLRILELHGVVTMNPISSLLNARDKYLSLSILSKHGLPVPDTLVTEDVLLAMEMSKIYGSCVLKPIIGSLGHGSLMTDNPDVVYQISKTMLSYNTPIYLQKFMEKKDNRDLRIFVVGNEVIGRIFRVAPKGSWKTNISQGGKALPAPRIPEVDELALKATKVLNLHYAGVDIAETKEGYVIFEVNAAPLWRGVQSVTKVNIASKIVEYLLTLLRK